MYKIFTLVFSRTIVFFFFFNFSACKYDSGKIILVCYDYNCQTIWYSNFSIVLSVVMRQVSSDSPSGPSPADSSTWAASWDTTVIPEDTDSWLTSPFGVPSGMMTSPCFCGEKNPVKWKKYQLWMLTILWPVICDTGQKFICNFIV